jgi:acyl-CoA thioesterase
MAFGFDNDARVVRAGDGSYRVTLSDKYNIGPVPNGGYVFAVMATPALEMLECDDVINATAYYLAPTQPGVPATIRCRELKRGRRLSCAAVELEQSGRIAVHATLLLGSLDRQEGETQSWEAAPNLPDKADCIRFQAGLGKKFQEQVELRMDPACVPFIRGERGDPRFRAWVRFADERPLDARSLLLFADALPPTSFNPFGIKGWVPTLELTVQVRARPVGQWLRTRVTTRHVTHGHFEEDVEMWDETDQLVAVSRQRAMLLQ